MLDVKFNNKLSCKWIYSYPINQCIYKGKHVKSCNCIYSRMREKWETGKTL